MEKHIKLVGILNIIYRSVAIIVALALFALAIGFKYIMELAAQLEHNEVHDIPQAVYTIAPIVLTCIGVLILIISIVGIIAAIGVLKRKEWARITLIVVSFFSLLKFPLGTALGIYSIWTLLNDDVIKSFGSLETSRKKK